MTFTAVLLFCSAGIAVCAGFVFLVETIVAFWLHDEEVIDRVSPRPIAIDSLSRDLPTDKAA